MHEEKVDFAWVVDEEDLVAGWSHVLGLLVAAEADLYVSMSAQCSLVADLCESLCVSSARASRGFAFRCGGCGH